MNRCEPSASNFVGNFYCVVDGQEKSEGLLAAPRGFRVPESDRDRAIWLTAEFSNISRHFGQCCSRAKERDNSPPVAFRLCTPLRQTWENWGGGETEKWPEAVPQPGQRQMSVNRPRVKRSFLAADPILSLSGIQPLRRSKAERCGAPVSATGTNDASEKPQQASPRSQPHSCRSYRLNKPREFSRFSS